MSSSDGEGDFYSDPVKQLAKFNDIESNDEDDLEITQNRISSPLPVKKTPKRKGRSIKSIKEGINLKIIEKSLPKKQRRQIHEKILNIENDDLETIENLSLSKRLKRIKSKKHSPIVTKRKRPMTRQQKLDCGEEISKSPPNTRGRGRKRKQNGSQSIIVISDNEDSEKITENTEQIVSNVNFEHKIKVWWQCSEFKDFYIRKYQKMKSIFDYYSQRENIPLNRLIFLVNNKTIYPNDTPDSLNLESIHIIEGGCINEDLEYQSHTESNNSSMIQLKIQLRDRKKPLEVHIKKTEPLSVLMAKCSEELECEIKKLKFQFDGDILNPQDTPESLDFDGGECIDVFIQSKDN